VLLVPWFYILSNVFVPSDVVNIATLAVFGIQRRVDDGFTYGQPFWMTVCSTIISTTTNIALVVDYLRISSFTSKGSGLTRKQRTLVVISIVLLTYIAFGALIQSFILKLSFIDALYFTVATIETVGKWTNLAKLVLSIRSSTSQDSETLSRRAQAPEYSRCSTSPLGSCISLSPSHTLGRHSLKELCYPSNTGYLAYGAGNVTGAYALDGGMPFNGDSGLKGHQRGLTAPELSWSHLRRDGHGARLRGVSGLALDGKRITITIVRVRIDADGGDDYT
jgi:hypothetical protein